MFPSRTSKSKIGQIGEDLACRYLIGKGYRILKRNYRQKWGELDIIARARNNALVFVEVKALRKNPVVGISPEDNLTAAKLQKLQRTCRGFVADKPELVREDRGWRIDLVTISIPANLDEPAPGDCEIRHYENI